MEEDVSDNKPRASGDRRHGVLWGYAGALVLLWSLVIGFSAWWNYYTHRQQLMEIARNEARTTINKDFAFRKWATTHGGVYVPVSDLTPPNPNLAHVPERDLETPSGRELTLMNPAYMLRQMMELYSSEFGVRTKITSLKPIWEGNAPDEWESAALLSFERGAGEVSEVSDISGEPYLRMIKPINISEGCLKCHTSQGYKLGDVRGGLGVYISLAPLFEVERDFVLKLIASHMAIWSVGMIGIIMAFMRVSGHMAERDRNEQRMERSLRENEVLLREVHHRVKNNMAIIASLLSMQSRHVLDENMRRMLIECRGRIRSMALVHEKLYGAQDFAKINFKSYARQLASDVIEMYKPNDGRAEVEIISDEKLTISLDTLIPLGLIINELVTNSMKHAFKDRAVRHSIRIELKELAGGAMLFSYKDNGPGLPAELDLENPKGMGLLVVNVLAAQLEGTIKYNRNGGGMGVSIEMPSQNG